MSLITGKNPGVAAASSSRRLPSRAAQSAHAADGAAEPAAAEPGAADPGVGAGGAGLAGSGAGGVGGSFLAVQPNTSTRLHKARMPASIGLPREVVIAMAQRSYCAVSARRDGASCRELAPAIAMEWWLQPEASMGLLVGAIVCTAVVGLLCLGLAYDRHVAARAQVVRVAYAPAAPRLPSAQTTLPGVGPDDLELRRTTVYAAIQPAPIPVAIAPEQTPLARPRPFARGTSAPVYGRAPTPTDVLAAQIDGYIADAFASIDRARG